MKGTANKRREEGVWVTLSGGSDQPLSFPIPCRFWREDGVWNGVTRDLAVAACGSSLEETMANLRAAIKSHFESAVELGLEGKDGI